MRDKHMPCFFSVSITETIFRSMLCAASELSCFVRAEDQAWLSVSASRSIELSSNCVLNGSELSICVEIRMHQNADVPSTHLAGMQDLSLSRYEMV